MQRRTSGTSDHAQASDGITALCATPRRCMASADTSPLLVYHPQSGLSNSLFGLASAALLATSLCRRFAVAWSLKSNPQAGASFADLFERPAGFEFLSIDEGREMIARLNGSVSTHSSCTLQVSIDQYALSSPTPRPPTSWHL